MESLEKRLVELLEEELQVYREIQAIKHVEGGALISFSARALEESNRALDSCVNRASVVEEERRDVAYRIAKPYWERAGEPTLRDLAPYLSPAIRSKVEVIAKNLSSVCVEIGRLQFGNTGIIKRSLRYLGELIEHLLRKAQFPPISYNSTGVLVPGKEAAPGILDRKV